MFSLLRAWLASQGVQRTLQGLRTGDQTVLYTGAAMLGLLALRRLNERRAYLLMSEEIPDGGTFVIRSSSRAGLEDLSLELPDGTLQALSEAKRVRRGRVRSRL